MWRVCAKFFPRHRTKPVLYEVFIFCDGKDTDLKSVSIEKY